MQLITNDIPKFPAGKAAVAPAVPSPKGIKAAITFTPKSDSESCPFRALIHEWIEACQADGLATKTRLDYQAKLFKFWWWWDKFHAAQLGAHPVNVTVKEARAFAAYLREPNAERWGEKTVRERYELSPASIASYGRAVKVFFSWLEREEYIPKSPFNKSVKFTSRHKQDRVVKTVEQDDLAKVFYALTRPEYVSTYHGARNLAMIALLLDSGMRRGELLNMRLCDINLDKNRCVINGKTGERWAFFNEICRDAIQRYLVEFRYPQEQQKSPFPAQQSTAPVWLTEDGHPVSYETVSSFTRQIERVSGVKLHLHMLRHTFASFMITRADVYTVQKLLGHSSVKTTEIYLHHSRDNLETHYRPNSPLDSLAGEESGLKRRRGRPRRK